MPQLCGRYEGSGLRIIFMRRLGHTGLQRIGCMLLEIREALHGCRIKLPEHSGQQPDGLIKI